MEEEECPYEVRVSPQFGRYLVAARDLTPRELLISEEPLIEGPTDEKDCPLCLGCCLKLSENPYLRCGKCHYPLCSLSCEEESLHSSNECKIFQENRVCYPPPHTKHILNKSIIILRCLLLEERDEEKWNKLMTMSDNGESRRNRPNCIIADERIMENLRKFMPHKPFDVEKVWKLSGILDVNAHSFTVQIKGKVVASKCHVYFKTSLLAHSCSPNSSWAPDKESKTRIIIKTNVFIPKGQLISVAYDDANLMHGTLRRLMRMEMSSMFICKCLRCMCPSELGTYLSAIKCQDCAQGYLLSLNPTDSFSSWKCDSCGRISDEIIISQVIEETEKAVGFPKGDQLLTHPDDDEEVALLKEFVEEYGKALLHPNHYIIQEVNLRIIRAECYSLQKLSEDELKQFLGRCKTLLEICDILTPGYGEYRAFLQYQYFRALLVHQEKVPLQLEDSQSIINQSRSIMFCSNSAEDLQTFLDRFKLILHMQKEVLLFLKEKFTTSPRIDYVKETMEFVEEQVSILERHIKNQKK